MRLIRYIVILFLFTGLGNNWNGWAQQNSNELLSVYELKQISKLLIEVEYRREKDSLTNKELNQYESVVKEFMNERDLWSIKEASYKLKIEGMKPKLYEQPLIVLTAGIITGYLIKTLFK